LLIGTPKRLDSPQMRMSARPAISSPPPTQMPWICATTGMAAVADRLDGAAHVFAVGARLLDVGALGLELGDVVAGREGARAGAAQHDAMHGVVPVDLGEDFPRRFHIGRVSAFSFSGRFSTTRAIAPSRSTRMVESMPDINSAPRGYNRTTPCPPPRPPPAFAPMPP
jgi:hypothetical protein